MDTNTHEQENKFHNTSSTPELSKNDVQRKESIHLDSASSRTRTSNRQKGKGKSAKKTTRSKTRTRRGRRKWNVIKRSKLLKNWRLSHWSLVVWFPFRCWTSLQKQLLDFAFCTSYISKQTLQPVVSGFWRNHQRCSCVRYYRVLEQKRGPRSRRIPSYVSTVAWRAFKQLC